jgi:hypothetical protein
MIVAKPKGARDRARRARANCEGRTPTRSVKKRGVKLGGLNAKGIAERQAARERAEQLRPLFVELAGLSARKAAEELNRRSVATPAGGKWHAATVLRVRERLA